MDYGRNRLQVFDACAFLSYCMRGTYLRHFALILTCQGSMVAAMCYFYPTPPWYNVFTGLAWVLPFLGYFFAFHDAPKFAVLPRMVKPIFLSCTFLAVTAVGFVASYVLVICLSLAFCGGHW
jgi:hypothetical protein